MCLLRMIREAQAIFKKPPTSIQALVQTSRDHFKKSLGNILVLIEVDSLDAELLTCILQARSHSINTDDTLGPLELTPFDHSQADWTKSPNSDSIAVSHAGIDNTVIAGRQDIRQVDGLFIADAVRDRQTVDVAVRDSDIFRLSALRARMSVEICNTWRCEYVLGNL